MSILGVRENLINERLELLADLLDFFGSVNLPRISHTIAEGYCERFKVCAVRREAEVFGKLRSHLQ